MGIIYFTVGFEMPLWWTVYCNFTADILQTETIEPCNKHLYKDDFTLSDIYKVILPM
jgi:hypothetical protein